MEVTISREAIQVGIRQVQDLIRCTCRLPRPLSVGYQLCELYIIPVIDQTSLDSIAVSSKLRCLSFSTFVLLS